MRIAPAVVRDCLRRGWPVVVTGSKVLGGPPFSGAVLSPRGRFPGADDRVALGPLLRWAAAARRAFGAGGRGRGSSRHAGAQDLGDRARGARPSRGPSSASGPSRRMCEASGWPASIVAFTLRDPADPSARLAAEALRPLHRALALRGVLVGQPVDLGPCGALRLAVGACDAAGFGDALARFADALREVAALRLTAGPRAARAASVDALSVPVQ